MTAITNVAEPTMGGRHSYRTHSSPIWGRSFPVAGLNEEQVKAIQKIAGFERLPNNWDSYGSPRISEEVIERAIEFVMASFDRGPSPRILPVSGGGIQFEWENDNRELEIEFTPDLNIEILLAEDGEPIEPRKAFTSIDDLLSWLIHGR
jgi:hypothetical protein